MEILFCDRCGRRVSDAQIESGEARRVDGGRVLCAACLGEVDTKAETEFSRGAAAQARQAAPAATGRPARSQRAPRGAGSQLPLYAGLFGLGIGLGVGFLVFLGGSAEEDRAQRPRTRTRSRSGAAVADGGAAGASAPEAGRRLPGDAAEKAGGAPGGTPVARRDEVVRAEGQAAVKEREGTATGTSRAGAGRADAESAGAGEDGEKAAVESAISLAGLEDFGSLTGQELYARISLVSALGYARAMPDDVHGQVGRYGLVIRGYPGTSAASRAEEGIRKLRAAHPGRFTGLAKVAPFKLPVKEYVDCPRRTGPVTVDGRLDEWSELPHECRRPQLIKIEQESWTGAVDSSFRFAVEHDDEYLYIAVETTDDVFYQETPETHPWQQDGIEIRVDARPDPPRSLSRGRTEFEDHMFVSLSPSERPEDVYAFEPEKWHAGMKAVCVKTAKGHNTEVALPVSYLDGKQRVKWQEFRFNVCVDDFEPLPGGGKVGAQIWWRPDWRTEYYVPGSGTFRRQGTP